jgi:hypothetical protein
MVAHSCALYFLFFYVSLDSYEKDILMSGFFIFSTPASFTQRFMFEHYKTQFCLDQRTVLGRI